MLSDISELSPNDLIAISQKFYAEKYRKNGKAQILSYETKPLSEVPCEFLSQHNVLTVNFECEGVGYTAQFFVKNIVKSLKEYVEEYGVFQKEVGVFQEIIPKLATLSSMKWAPLFYLSKENVMVFENLQTSDPSDPNAMKSKAHNYVVDTLAELLVRIPKYKDSLIEILPAFRQLVHRMKAFVKPSTEYRNVFCHGDLWANNILFKYATFSNGIDINDRIPVEAILVDFQLARYAPPALDLMVMLTITSTCDFRKQYLARLCDAYYDHLAFELKNHSIDIEVEYPRHQFDESCTFYRMVGLMESCLFSHLTKLPQDLLLTATNDSEKRNNFMTKSKTAVCLEAFDTNENYRSRMSDMLMELVDEYVLPKCS